MNSTFYVFVLGTLALAVSAVVGGIWLHNGWGAMLIVAGVVGLVAWLIMLFEIANALNSDI